MSTLPETATVKPTVNWRLVSRWQIRDGTAECWEVSAGVGRIIISSRKNTHLTEDRVLSLMRSAERKARRGSR